MPTIYKVLAQSAPSTTSIANVYTVPAATNTVISTLMICNRATVNASYNIAVVPSAAAAIANQHYIAFNTIVPANDSIALTVGMSLAATDNVAIQANTTGVNNLGFTLFGTEIS
jgi:IMP cyclohydrolase